MKKAIISALTVSAVVSGLVVAQQTGGMMTGGTMTGGAMTGGTMTGGTMTGGTMTGGTMTGGAVADGTLADVAADNADLSTFVEALTAAGLAEEFSGDQAYTIFAPSNAAFDALPEGQLDELLNNPQELADLLQYHVVSGTFTAGELVTLPSTLTLTGEELSVTGEGDSIVVGGATVIEPDIRASNGVIHVINAVLTPPE